MSKRLVSVKNYLNFKEYALGELTESGSAERGVRRIPDYKNNRECDLVLGRFDAHVIAKSAGGVSASNADALGGKHPPTEGSLSKTAGTKSAG
jgi:hypothetical protein